MWTTSDIAACVTRNVYQNTAFSPSVCGFEQIAQILLSIIVLYLHVRLIVRTIIMAVVPKERPSQSDRASKRYHKKICTNRYKAPSKLCIIVRDQNAQHWQYFRLHKYANTIPRPRRTKDLWWTSEAESNVAAARDDLARPKWNHRVPVWGIEAVVQLSKVQRTDPPGPGSGWRQIITSEPNTRSPFGQGAQRREGEAGRPWPMVTCK